MIERSKNKKDELKTALISKVNLIMDNNNAILTLS